MRQNDRMKKHDKPLHGSREWLELRHRIDDRCVIGASEVPALMNQSSWKTRADLFIEKTRPVEINEPTNAMRRGTLLEPALIEFAQQELDQQIIVPDVMFQQERIIATLDGQIADDWGIECKTSNAWVDGNPLPIEWILQAQAQMFAAEMTRVTFSILDRNLRLSLADVARDDILIDAIDLEARIFAEMIDNGSDFDEGVFTLPQVASLYPDPAGEIELDPSMIDLIIEWNALKDQAKQIDHREKAIKDQLANAMRDAEFGIINGERVISFKAQKQSRIDNTKLKQILDEEIIASITSTSSFRVMRAMI